MMMMMKKKEEWLKYPDHRLKMKMMKMKMKMVVIVVRSGIGICGRVIPPVPPFSRHVPNSLSDRIIHATKPKLETVFG